MTFYEYWKMWLFQYMCAIMQLVLMPFGKYYYSPFILLELFWDTSLVLIAKQNPSKSSADSAKFSGVRFASKIVKCNRTYSFRNPSKATCVKIPFHSNILNTLFGVNELTAILFRHEVLTAQSVSLKRYYFCVYFNLQYKISVFFVISR